MIIDQRTVKGDKKCQTFLDSDFCNNNLTLAKSGNCVI
jgi:hypothetical protein